MNSINMAAEAGAVEPAGGKFAAHCQDVLANSDQLHRELSDAAVAESAQTARIVWAQVKGFPFWPVRQRTLIWPRVPGDDLPSSRHPSVCISERLDSDFVPFSTCVAGMSAVCAATSP
jgi:hypothetical protein